MNILTKAALFLLLAISSHAFSASKYSDTPSQGSKGKWGWSNAIAKTSFKNGITLDVLFVDDYQCELAYFVISGNDEIDEISFTIDSKGFKSVQVEPTELRNGERVVGFPLSNSALRALKKGSILKIDTDEGRLFSSLEGSALSFNMAYGNCMKSAEAMALKPSRTISSKKRAGELGGQQHTKLSTSEFDGNMVVLFNGEFDKGDGPKIMHELTESGATLLILNSLGGLVSEAQMVGYYLRSNNIASMAGEICASACVYALAGGVERYAISESKVGIHRSKTPGVSGTLEAGQYITGNYIRYFNSMDIDTEIVAIASSTSSDGMHWLTMKEMINLNLITDNSE